MPTRPSLGEARLRTSLDPSGLRAGLNTARRESETTFGRIERRMDTMGQGFQRVGGTLTRTLTPAIIGAGAAAVTAVVSLGRFADSILDAEQATGVSAERLQEWRAAARAAQIDSDALERGAHSLTRRLRQIDDDSGAASAAMGNLGFTTAEAQAAMSDMDTFMPQILGRLQDMDNITERNRIAVDLFGRSYDRLAPILGVTREEFERVTSAARESGEVMDRETLRTAADASRQFDELRAELGLVWRELQIELIPAFQAGADIMRNTVVPAARDLIGHIQGLLEWFNDLDEGTQRWIFTVAGIAAAAGPAAVAIGTLVRALAAMRTVLLALSGPAGLLALAAGAVVLLATNAANARTPLQNLADDIDDIARANRDLIDTTHVATEAQRQAALDRARIQQREAAAALVAAQRRMDELEQAAVEMGLTLAEVPIDIFQPVQNALDEAQAAFDEVSDHIHELRELDITPPIDDAGDAFNDAAGDAEDFGATASGAVDDVTESVTTLQEALRDLATDPEGFERFLQRMGIVADEFEALQRMGIAFDFAPPVARPDIGVADPFAVMEDQQRAELERRMEARAEREAERAERRAEFELRRVADAQLELQRVADPQAVREALANQAAEVLRVATDEVVSTLSTGFGNLVDAGVSVVEATTARLGPAAQRLQQQERIAAAEAAIAQLTESLGPAVIATAKVAITATQDVIDAHREYTESLDPVVIATAKAAEAAGQWTSEIERLLIAQERHTRGLRETAPTGFVREGEGLNLRMVLDPQTAPDVVSFEPIENELEEVLARQAVQFGQNLAQAVQTGDFENVITSTLQQATGVGAQAITAALPGPTGILAGGAVSIFGTLLSGLLGSGAGQQREQAERAQRTARAAPAITLSATVNQTNHIEQGIDAPQTRAQLRELARDVAIEMLREIGADEALKQARG